MNKNLEGTDILKEKLKGNFDKHDKLLYQRDRFEFYLCEATAELKEVKKNIHLVNKKISLIDEQINSLLAMRNAFRKETIKDSDAFILYEDVETKDFSNTFGQSNFDWVYSDGMELFINDNKKRIENYKKILYRLKDRRKFLEKRISKLQELIGEIDTAISFNKFKVGIKALVFSTGYLNNREVPSIRPKAK